MSTLVKKEDSLQKGILEALVFYDMFDYPLTLIEIWRFLQDHHGSLKGGFTLSDIKEEIFGNHFLQLKICSKHGFYMLCGREGLYEARMLRHNNAQRRWKKAVRLIGLLKSIPFLRMVAVCNMFPIDTPKVDSDIDVVVVAKDKRIWLVRLLVTFVIAVTGQWRHRVVADKLCLSFFISDNHLNLQRIYEKKRVKMEDDPYLANWVALVSPIYDIKGTAKKFREENSWIDEFLPNAYQYFGVPDRQVRPNSFERGWQSFWEYILGSRFGDGVERFVRWWQLQYMKARADKGWLQNPNVVRSDEMLKFHEVDRRDHFRDAFNKKLKSI